MSSYLEQVNAELDELGIPEATAPYRRPYEWGYRELALIVNRTYLHPDTLTQLEGVARARTISYPAQQAAAIIEYGQRPPELRCHICCSSAELRLMENLEPEAIEAPNYVPPLVLTREDRAVGIIKSLGETSCYGLSNEPEHGIIKGVFGTPVNRQETIRMFRTGQAPVESVGGIIPLRLSAFTVPVSERLLLNTTDDEREHKVLSMAHEDIAQQAYRLLGRTQPALPKPQ